MMLLVALLIGVVAGLRAFTAPAAVAWAAHLGILDLGATPLAFLAHRFAPWILTALALLELVGDQLPATPSRKTLPQFGTRIVTGALSGAAIGASGGSLAVGGILGAIGAVIGTLGGAAVRTRLAVAFCSDRPAGLLEDVVAVGGAALLIGVLA